MKLITDIIPIGYKCRTEKPLKEVKFITLHWIGPYPNQSVHTPRGWWMKSGGDAAAHYVVKDDTVLLCIPTNEVAYHCGNTEGNNCSIGIEIIPASIKGEFGESTLATLKELITTLPDVPLKRHYDWTGKNCPQHYTSLVDGGEARWGELSKWLKDHI
jgi:N-acetyl-anhydromuramyl-L-alanine amidase AmpD